MKNYHTACALASNSSVPLGILTYVCSLQFDPAPRAGEPLVSRRVPDYFLVSYRYVRYLNMISILISVQTVIKPLPSSTSYIFHPPCTIETPTSFQSTDTNQATLIHSKPTSYMTSSFFAPHRHCVVVFCLYLSLIFQFTATSL
jgi:hypothetical protein